MNYIKKEHCVYAMDKENPPVLTVNSGDDIVFETFDCFTNQITEDDGSFEKLDWDRINPATGPVFVEGAEVGDTLLVSIKKIDITGNATVFTGPGAGVMGDELTENTIKVMPIVDNQLVFSDNIGCIIFDVDEEIHSHLFFYKIIETYELSR